MRSRVMSHFADDLRSARQMQLAREVRSIDWERTAGELGATLREAALVKELLPAFNRKSRRAKPAEMKTLSWPWRGAIGVIESDLENDETEVHLIDRWCYLGTAKSDAEVGELLQGVRPRFDIDQYKLLARHLRRPGVRVVGLAA